MPSLMSAGPTGSDPGTGGLVSLLITLSADYPDLDQHTVALAVERAAVAAEALSPGLRPPVGRVELLARDRLDAVIGHLAGRARQVQLTG